MDSPQDCIGSHLFVCKGPHTVGFTSVVFIHFARGTPPYASIELTYIVKPYGSRTCRMGVPLGFHLMIEYILRGPHCDFIGLHYMLQGLLLQLDWILFCEEDPSRFVATGKL